MTAPALAAATAVADVLAALFVVLLAAKLGDELFKRLGQPALVGEIRWRRRRRARSWARP